ncbi:MAG TPA: hypothetical protein VMW56_17710 [Candidatus Margulisiibacteriota bacterium]|nr:hypothetical protein [Candidatus Margulisiibacteriota bacterium]
MKASRIVVLVGALLISGMLTCTLTLGGIPIVSRPRTWSIGIYTGPSFRALAPSNTVINPVLSAADVTDVPAKFVADPFMIKRDSTWYMFFEVLHARTGKGVIAVASSTDGYHWLYRGVVLEEPFHLSYPYVFAFRDEYYMIPESGQAQSVRLYKAAEFPTRWVMAATLLTGRAYADSSLVEYGGKWWLFTDPNSLANDRLSLYVADHLEGPWSEHPRSPIVSGDPHSARPAGRVVVSEGKLFRFAQDDAPTYGIQVWAFEVTELTTVRYSEQRLGEAAILGPGSAVWNEKGMHHLDPHQVGDDIWIACVDGWQKHVAFGLYYWR